MNINWKLRFQNKTTLTAIVLSVIAIFYNLLRMTGIVPQIGEEEVENMVLMVIDLLVLIGVVVDPTTDGLGDSKQAMLYDKPRVSK